MKIKLIKKISRKIRKNIFSVNDSRYFRFKHFSILIGVFVLILISNISFTNAFTIGKTMTDKIGSSGLLNGLVGHWTFDGKNLINNAVDSSGYNNKGYLKNISTTSSVVAGKLGQALNFDGVDDRIEVQISSGLPIYSTSLPYSVSFWIKAGTQSDTNYVYSEGNSGSSAQVFGLAANGTKMAVYIRPDSGLVVRDYTSSNSIVFNNKWHHIVWTDVAGTAKMYVDGVLDSTNFSYTPSGSYTFNIATIGMLGRNTYSKALLGLLDDFRVYNRVISPEEVKVLYRQGVSSFSVSNIKDASSYLGANQGLVGYWTFDGKNLINNVVDSSGAGHTGTFTNFPATSSAVVVGKVGQALWFDGTDDQINTTSEFLGTSPLTISAWLKIRGLGGLSAGRIIDNGSFAFRLDSSNRVAMTNDSSLVAYSANNSFVFDQWVHVVGVRDGSNQCTIYINGVISSTANQNCGTLTSGSTNVTIGNRSTGSRTFDGVIDDLRIYNRVLSATEILQLYNSANSKVAITASMPSDSLLKNGLVGHWTFDGKNLINNAVDSSGYNNTGYLKNISTTSAVIAGKIGQAIRFDGTNDYVDAGNDSSLDFPDTSFSYSFWIYSSVVQARNVISNRATDSASSKGYSVYFANGSPNGRLEMRFIDGTDHSYVISSSITYNRWHHVSVVWNRESATVTAYLNGVQSLAPTSIVSVGSIPKSTSFKIGNGEKGYLNGMMDDVRIYNRAISASEVLKLYNMGK